MHEHLTGRITGDQRLSQYTTLSFLLQVPFSPSVWVCGGQKGGESRWSPESWLAAVGIWPGSGSTSGYETFRVRFCGAVVASRCFTRYFVLERVQIGCVPRRRLASPVGEVADSLSGFCAFNIRKYGASSPPERESIPRAAQRGEMSYYRGRGGSKKLFHRSIQSTYHILYF